MPLTEPYEPVELSAADRAFPAHALDWMPEWDDIPEEHRKNGHGWTSEFWSDTFYRGLDDVQLIPVDLSWDQERVDRAFNHLHAIAGSYAPKHEHKMAALSFLTEEWFEAVRWKPKGATEWKSTPDVEWP